VYTYDVHVRHILILLSQAHSNSGKPEIYLTDSGSMHGTMLNSQRLPANTPTILKYGDVIQLGADVNRNEGASPRKPPHLLSRCSTSRLQATQDGSSSQAGNQILG
jgi:pSer/pThr/pTyr-binding forkhead associated (FHA) protein